MRDKRCVSKDVYQKTSTPKTCIKKSKDYENKTKRKMAAGFVPAS